MTTYSDSGVDIARGDETVKRLKDHVESTFTGDVLRGVGSFAGAISVSALKGMDDPVLLASIDGVGTKTIIAEMTGKWENIGKDIVGHSGNDLVCQGTIPLLFLDYVASSKLDPQTIEAIVKGMCESCRELGCVLIGGETAEMPKVYAEGAHDVVGSIVGVVERKKMITGENIKEGDVLIALPSNGLHTNGYSLARKVLLEDVAMDLDVGMPELDGETLGDALLKPHTSYVKTVLKLHDEIGIKGIAHITGGGIKGNLSRIIPDGLGAKIDKDVIKHPPIFDLIQKTGDVSEDAMFEAFNMGVGMILVVGQDKAESVLKMTDGYVVGIVDGEIGIELM